MSSNATRSTSRDKVPETKTTGRIYANIDHANKLGSTRRQSPLLMFKTWLKNDLERVQGYLLLERRRLNRPQKLTQVWFLHIPCQLDTVKVVPCLLQVKNVQS